MTKRKGIITAVVTLTLLANLFIPLTGTDEIYAGSKSDTKKVKSLKKAIKSYNKKVQSIAKRTPKAKSLAKSTKKCYNKSKKTKKIKALKKYCSKSKSAYRKAQIYDYQHQINSYNKEIKSISYKAPSMKSYISKSASINKDARNCNVRSTLKSYLLKIKNVHTQATSHKATLSWHETEYRQEWVEGHYKTTITQPAEYKFMLVSYYVQLAESKGYKTGYAYGWDLEKCKANGAIFPYSKNNAEMKAWGCQYYSFDNDRTIYDIIPSSESSEFAKYLNSIGLGSQSRETGEWFLMQEEISETKWVDGYNKNILIRKSGWY